MSLGYLKSKIWDKGMCDICLEGERNNALGVEIGREEMGKYRGYYTYSYHCQWLEFNLVEKMLDAILECTSQSYSLPQGIVTRVFLQLLSSVIGWRLLPGGNISLGTSGLTLSGKAGYWSQSKL